jgi:hypothetical protein
MTPADARELACGCGARVRWYITIGGKPVQLNADPHPDGNVIVVPHDGHIRARILTGNDLPAQQQAYRRHICPPTPGRPGPACGACKAPMDRALATLERWSVHPTCEPDYVAELKPKRRKRR